MPDVWAKEATPRCKAHTGFDTKGNQTRTTMPPHKMVNQTRAAVAVALHPQKVRIVSSDRWALSWLERNSRVWDSHSGDSVPLPEGLEFHKCYSS